MSSNDSLVPNAKAGLQHFKGTVMEKQGYHVDLESPDHVKYEVAEEVGVPLKKGYNGDLTAKQAGKIGGSIGGPMVREMIKMGEKSLTNKS